MRNQPYPSDTTDAQWEIIRPLIPPLVGQGRPRVVDLRDVVDAIFYINRTGVAYRFLPHDFPPWQTVYYYLEKWQKDGTLDAVHAALRDAVRAKERPTERTTACVDSQTSDSHGAREDRGFDGGKKIEGRKRHLIVDSLGLVLAVAVTSAAVSDARGGAAALDRLRDEDVRKVATMYADGAYAREGFDAAVAARIKGCEVEVVSRPKGARGFVRLPIRWVVERTNGWVTKNRRLCRSYEHTTAMEEGYVKWAMVSVMMRRLSPPRKKIEFGYRQN